jgi:Ca-activated chloride channel family protein
LKPSTPLASTALEVTITDLVAEYLIRHNFRNDGKDAIEAVFSFPVPLDAAFLGMQATLAGEKLVAEIQPQRQASRAYDDAVAGGNSAVLLRAPEPGLLCTSLGNLMPGETGEIELRFVTSLRVADRTARFSLPLVHRPRYGTWRLEELETPTHDFAIEHPMSATIHVEGLLASAPVSCATHAARFAHKDGALELSITQAMLDRDLVLTFELSEELPPVVRLIEDGDRNLGLVSLVLPASRESVRALDLCLLLDGSGSMQGDAIVQSRQAMGAIVDALGDHDRIQVLRFGSSVVPMFRRPLLATPRVREALRELIPTIDAELGGTEMGQALERSLNQLGPMEPGRSRAVILVTDGAVQSQDINDAQFAALAAGVRIFVVAVGSSAGAEVLGPMAEITGAVLERAVPAEPIDICVMRQFRRAREPGATELNVTWPGPEAFAIPMGVAYPGDAVNLAACLPAGAQGHVVVEAASLSFSLHLALAARASEPAARALLGQQRYRLAEADQRESIALRYGLLTEETSAVLVKIRADGQKADGLPTIVRVPHMVTEGMNAIAVDPALFMRTSLSAARSVSYDDAADYDLPLFSLQSGVERSDGRSGGRRLSKPQVETIAVAASPTRTREILLELHRLLSESWLQIPSPSSVLAEIVGRLPSDMRIEALCLIHESGLTTETKGEGLQLLIALTEALGLPPFYDEEEAELTMAIFLSGEDQDWMTEVHAEKDAELVQNLGTFLRDGFSANLARSILDDFEHAPA